jgi:hypothetical protein
LHIFIIDPVAVTYSWLQLQKDLLKKKLNVEIIKELKTGIGFNFQIKILLKIEVEHDSEFEYNNQMYDVVEKLIVNDSTQLLWCWWDQQSKTKLNIKLQN